MKPAQENPREFWNQKFIGSTEEWKIDYPPSQLLAEHQLFINHRHRVLDIGVGRGDFARYCVRHSVRVYCCDVSDVALEGVKDVGAEHLVLYKDIDQLPVVDVAIANLVFQHCADDVVVNILRSVKLAGQGVFSFQSASVIGEYPQWLKDQTSTGYLTMRNVEQIKALVKASGNKNLAAVSGPLAVRDFPDVNMVHHFYKVITAE